MCVALASGIGKSGDARSVSSHYSVFVWRDWSAHWHLHTKIHNRLDPATTAKLVYVYPSSILVASTCDADKLISSRCLLGTMTMFRFSTAGLLRQGGPGWTSAPRPAPPGKISAPRPAPRSRQGVTIPS